MPLSSDNRISFFHSSSEKQQGMVLFVEGNVLYVFNEAVVTARSSLTSGKSSSGI